MPSLVVKVMGHMARKEGSKLIELNIVALLRKCQNAKHSVLATKCLSWTTQLAARFFAWYHG